MLNYLASTNISSTDLNYLKLDILFIYNTILVQIHSILVSQILTKYEANNY